MFENPAIPALLKITFCFLLMLFAIRRHWPLWLAVLTGGVVLGFLFGLTPAAIAVTMGKALAQPSFATLFAIVGLIMLLSELQGITGQGRRLVEGLSPYIKSPRVRLIFFPALVGLLPMPGGAVFSCPMVRDVGATLDINEQKKALINYWFRHLWESAWPLYPGYILTCAIADIPPSLLWRYGLPLVVLNILVGWFMLLRDPIKETELPDASVPKQPLSRVLLEGLPILVAVLAAPVYGGIFSLIGFAAPNGLSFVCSFLSAILLVIWQNKFPPVKVPGLLLQHSVYKMLLLVVVIFIFKEIVITAKVVEDLAAIMTGKSALFIMFLFLPLMMGLLTGVMLGFVGAAFPLIMALLSQAGMYEERLCWILVALVSGNTGQMISPLHSCYLLTLEYFKVPLGAVWGIIFKASCTQTILALAYVAALYYFVHPLLN